MIRKSSYIFTHIVVVSSVHCYGWNCDLVSFSFSLKTSFNISCTMNMLRINTFNYCVPEKNILPSNVKYIFTEYSILEWYLFFFFQYFKHIGLLFSCFHCFWQKKIFCYINLSFFVCNMVLANWLCWALM